MIPGLTIIENYLSEAEELALVQLLGLKETTKGTSRNSIKRYGSSLPYNGKIVSEEIPSHLQTLCDKLFTDKFHNEPPDSVTVNEYRKGQKIDYHYDSKKSGPVITVLSLLGNAKMGFRRIKGQEQFYEVPRRALVTIKDDARKRWQHCILPVDNDRISLVFRNGTLDKVP